MANVDLHVQHCLPNNFNDNKLPCLMENFGHLFNFYQKIRKGAHFLRERGLTLTELKTARFWV